MIQRGIKSSPLLSVLLLLEVSALAAVEVAQLSFIPTWLVGAL